MPYAVTHVLAGIITLDLIRDYWIKDKKGFPLYMIFIGGLAGLLPDLDIPIGWLFKSAFGVELMHRTITHSLVFPLIFFLLSLILFRNKKYSMIFAIVTYGISLHILLDMLIAGYVMPFYPFYATQIGLGLIGGLPLDGVMAGLDAVVLLIWLYHEEVRHKISDFI
jgi:membrane-bound metal-dependent hydrolase YbcI (DUF457 family)